MTDDPTVPLFRVVVDVEVLGNILFDHVHVEPDKNDPPRVGYAGGSICGCGASIGTFGPGIYRQLAKHQAMEAATRAESFVTFTPPPGERHAPGH